MARWRAEALKRLPELRRTIESAGSIMALWIELLDVFEAAYRAEPRDEPTIARIYSFADWCIQAPRGPDAGTDPFSAVIGFYEDIPTIAPARQDMPRWFKYSEVAENRSTFSYSIGDEAYEQLLKFMDRHRQQFRPRTQELDGSS